MGFGLGLRFGGVVMAGCVLGLHAEVEGYILIALGAGVFGLEMVEHKRWRSAGNKADWTIVVQSFTAKTVARVGVMAKFHMTALPARPIYPGRSYARRVWTVDDAVVHTSMGE